jgi:hypothetical protein
MDPETTSPPAAVAAAVTDASEDQRHPIYEPIIDGLPTPPSSPNRKSKSWSKYNRTMRESKWLVKELEDEIDAARPMDDDIDENGNRNEARLAHVFAKIFYTGRMFYNFYQLSQMVQKFADLWGFDIFLDAFSIKCSFAKPRPKKPSNVPVADQRKRATSLKEAIQCSFIVKVTDIGRCNNNPQHRSKLQVRITEVIPTHSCRPGAELAICWSNHSGQ